MKSTILKVVKIYIIGQIIIMIVGVISYAVFMGMALYGAATTDSSIAEWEFREAERYTVLENEEYCDFRNCDSLMEMAVEWKNHR